MVRQGTRRLDSPSRPKEGAGVAKGGNNSDNTHAPPAAMVGVATYHTLEALVRLVVGAIAPARALWRSRPIQATAGNTGVPQVSLPYRLGVKVEVHAAAGVSVSPR
jgi:hypothetical protein